MYENMSLMDAVVWCLKNGGEIVVHNGDWVLGEVAGAPTLTFCVSPMQDEDKPTFTATRLSGAIAILDDVLCEDINHGWVVS